MTAPAWWKSLHPALKAIAFVATCAAVVFGSGAGAARTLGQVELLPARVSSVEDSIAVHSLRMNRQDVRLDSLLRVTTQSFCLQRAQASGSDWTRCVQ